MKGLRFIFVSAVALLSLAACVEQEPYTPGGPTNSNGNNVYFSAKNPGQLVLGLTDNTFKVTLERESGSGAISVPLTAYSESNVFTVPSAVDFAAGETSKDITVQFKNAEPFVNYIVRIAIPEEFTNQYKNQEVYPVFSTTVLQEDFKAYHTGRYSDDFYFEESWEQVLEYSELLKTYRFKGLWKDANGSFSFKWDGADKFELPGKFETGIVHSKYGMISVTPDAKNTYYDAEEKAIHFSFTWTVTAGSFGTYENVFYF